MHNYLIGIISNRESKSAKKIGHTILWIVSGRNNIEPFIALWNGWGICGKIGHHWGVTWNFTNNKNTHHEFFVVTI